MATGSATSAATAPSSAAASPSTAKPPDDRRHAAKVPLSRLGDPAGVCILPLRIRPQQDHPWPVQLRRHCAPAPRRTLDAANTDVAGMIPIVWNSFPAPLGFSIELFQKAHLGPRVRPLMRDVVGDVGRIAVDPDGLDWHRAADRVRQCRQSDAGSSGGPAPGTGHLLGAGGQPLAHRQEFLLESVVIGVLGSGWDAVRLGRASPAGRRWPRRACRALPISASIGWCWRSRSRLRCLRASSLARPGPPLRGGAHGHRAARRRPRIEPGPRAPSHPQHAGRDPGEPGLRPARSARG